MLEPDDLQRDLVADLAVTTKATPGPWYFEAGKHDNWHTAQSAALRTGWKMLNDEHRAVFYRNSILIPVAALSGDAFWKDKFRREAPHIHKRTSSKQPVDFTEKPPKLWVTMDFQIRPEDANFIEAARVGWPVAVRRALAAEAEVELLRSRVERLEAEIARLASNSAK